MHIFYSYIYTCICSADPIEIRVEADADGTEQLNDVADVVLYFRHTLTDEMYAVIRYYTVQQGIGPIAFLHRKLMVPRIKTRDPTLFTTFGCIQVSQIAAHAHIVPDFDTPVDGEFSFFFWDIHLP